MRFDTIYALDDCLLFTIRSIVWWCQEMSSWCFWRTLRTDVSCEVRWSVSYCVTFSAMKYIYHIFVICTHNNEHSCRWALWACHSKRTSVSNCRIFKSYSRICNIANWMYFIRYNNCTDNPEIQSPKHAIRRQLADRVQRTVDIKFGQDFAVARRSSTEYQIKLNFWRKYNIYVSTCVCVCADFGCVCVCECLRTSNKPIQSQPIVLARIFSGPTSCDQICISLVRVRNSSCRCQCARATGQIRESHTVTISWHGRCTSTGHTTAGAQYNIKNLSVVKNSPTNPSKNIQISAQLIWIIRARLREHFHPRCRRRRCLRLHWCRVPALNDFFLSLYFPSRAHAGKTGTRVECLWTLRTLLVDFNEAAAVRAYAAITLPDG